MDRKKLFDRNIKSVSDGLSVYSYVNNNAKQFDSSILLREQYAMIISAFDTYLHGIVEDEIVRHALDAADCEEMSFDIGIETLREMVANRDQSKAIIRSDIRNRLSEISFQSPRSVEYAIGFFKVKHLWRTIGNEIAMSAEDVRNKLAICIRRRNKITHESDWNPAIMDYDKIERADVEECMDFIVKMVNAIESILSQG